MANSAYTYDEATFSVSDEMKNSYRSNGYALVKGLFSKQEVSHVDHALSEGKYMDYKYGLDDGAGSKKAYQVLWFYAGNDVTGMFLGGEVYHYHSKVLMKPPKLGGKFIWHQDYGYFYDAGFLTPEMLTVFIAVDRCSKENGCLQVLKGSHKCGRLEHKDIGRHISTDLDRVEQIKKVFPLVYMEMDPGDALFFDSNLLHCSSENMSSSRRWAFLCVYSRADNSPCSDHIPSFYRPLEKVPNSALLQCKDVTSLDGKHFHDPNGTDPRPNARK